MAEQKSRATVDIYGESYVVKGEATPEYLEMLANYVDKKMKQIGSRQPQLSVQKIAVLAALIVADELSKLQEDYDTLVKMMDDKKDHKGEHKIDEARSGHKHDHKHGQKYEKHQHHQQRQQQQQQLQKAELKEELLEGQQALQEPQSKPEGETDTLFENSPENQKQA